MRWGSALAGVALIVGALLLLTGHAPWELARHEQRAGIDASVVRLDLGSGGVEVRRGRVDEVELVARGWSLWQPGESWQRDGDVLTLQDCGWFCSVRYDLVVPPGTRVEGETGSGSVRVVGVASVDVEVNSGSIEVRDVAGAARASTSSGSVLLDRVRGPVTAHSSSGSITGSALAGPVNATTSSGDVAVTLTRPQDVRAETSSGDVDVRVPSGRYRITTEGSGSDSGDAARYPAGIVDDPGARYLLELHTSSGDATVRAR